jgi:ParB family transcriptional regulator, chromosome partitioning protein
VVRPSGLGKGLGALIPSADRGAEPGAQLRDLPLHLIRPNPFQPRTQFNDDALASLTASIREIGVLQPVLVREVGDHFELIAGERRWRAAGEAGLGTIPALVRDVDDTVSLEQALVENLQREDLTALEEAAAYQQLGEDFGLSDEQIAQRVGRSKSAVANTVRLLQLPPVVQRMVNERSLSAGHARALVTVPGVAVQEAHARRAVAEGLSVRALEGAARRAIAAAESESETDRVVAASHKPASLLELEQLLGEHLDTRVSVNLGGKQRGRIVIDFAGLEDLERVYRAITSGRETRA